MFFILDFHTKRIESCPPEQKKSPLSEKLTQVDAPLENKN
jgi:hypothetical protein